MSKKMRQKVTVIVLCCLLIGAVAGYYGVICYQENRQKKEAQANDQTIELYSWKKEQIKQIYFKSAKTEMTLIKEKEKWINAEEKDFVPDQNKAGFMLDAIASLKAEKLVAEDVTDLEQFQLSEPELIIKIWDLDGNEKKIAIGEESLSGGGRYAYCDDDSKVYIVPTSVYSNFDYTKKELKGE